MKNFVKIVALSLAMLMLLCGFAVAEEKPKLIVGTNPEFPPYEYVGDTGEMIGIDIDLAQLIADELGYELVMEAMLFDGLVTAVATGKIDLAIAGMTVKPERLESVDFTDAYCTATQVIIVKEGSEIKEIADLAGKKIGVQLGTTGDYYATDDVESAEVSRYEKAVDAVSDVAAGRLDAVVVDNGPAQVFVQKFPGTVILPYELTSEEYAIAVNKQNTELRDKINALLTVVKEDGRLEALISENELAFFDNMSEEAE